MVLVADCLSRIYPVALSMIGLLNYTILSRLVAADSNATDPAVPFSVVMSWTSVLEGIGFGR